MQNPTPLSLLRVAALAGLAAALPQATTTSPPISETNVFSNAFTTTTWSVQTTMTAMVIPWMEGASPLASVVSADSTATTFTLQCPPGAYGHDCGFGPGITIVNRNVNDPAATDRGYTYIIDADVVDGTSTVDPAFTLACDLVGGTAEDRDMVAACVNPDDATETITTDFNEFINDVVVTAGAENLVGGAAAATTTGEDAAEASESGSAGSDGDESAAGRSGVEGMLMAGVAAAVGVVLL